jgi:hypothetical protein
LTPDISCMLKKIILLILSSLLLSGCSLLNNDSASHDSENKVLSYSEWINSTNADKDLKFDGTSEYKRESFYYIKPTIDSLESVLGGKRLSIEDSVFKEADPNLYFCKNRLSEDMLIMGNNNLTEFNGYISVEELKQFSDATKNELFTKESYYVGELFPGLDASTLPYEMVNYAVKIDKDFYLITIEVDTSWNLLINKNYSEFADPGNLDFSELPTNDYMPFKITIVLKEECPTLPID